jgi:hypothetical protein
MISKSRFESDSALSADVMDYQQYLSSPLWKKIRSRVLYRRDKRICYHCGGAAVLVHHRSYSREVLEGHADQMLVSLCAGCHEYIHFNIGGIARSLKAANRVLQKRSPPTEIPEPRVRVDLRREQPVGVPAEWPRMTAIQRQGWLDRFKKLWDAKRDSLWEKQAAEARRRLSTPRNRTPEGRASLIVAYDLWSKEPGTPLNSYAWYRDSARTSGEIHLHLDRAALKVEKIGGTWFLSESKLRAALALQRKRERARKGKRKARSRISPKYAHRF